MERLHTDVCGPFPMATKTSKHYFVSIINDTTRFATVVAICKKSDVKAVLCNYLAAAPTGHWLHSDQGGEYTGERVQELLQSASIMHEATLVHTPEHNGVAEHFNQTIIEMVQCMLHDSSLGKSYWGEALRTATTIYNRLPTNTNDGTSPLDRWEPNNTGVLHNIHQFGEKVEVLVPPGEHSKLSACTWTGIYLGPAVSRVSTHHMLVQGHVIMTHEVVFSQEAHERSWPTPSQLARQSPHPLPR